VSQVRPLYSTEQRHRRDQSPWTLVQGVLAPIQFLVFLVSACLIVRYLITNTGYDAATASILVKTFLLYLIMITGAIWEKQVFGQYLFAESFYWEDVVSMLVMVLHTAYVVALLTDLLGSQALLWLALTAYASYVINAVQFIVKFRLARLSKPVNASHSATVATRSTVNATVGQGGLKQVIVGQSHGS